MVGPLAFMGAEGASKKLYEYLSKFLPESGTVLDLGCGIGEWLKFVKQIGLEGFGIELDKTLVNHCVSRGLKVSNRDLIEYLENNIEKKFDVISAVHLVEHFEPYRVEKIISLMSKSLSRHGVLILVTPNFSDLKVSREIFWLDPTHVRPYPLPLLVEICKSNDLSIVEQKTTGMIKIGLKEKFIYPLNLIRFGSQYGKMNAILVARKSI